MRLQRRLRVVNPRSESQQSIKVAFATTDMRQVNQHFGSAKSLAVYSVSEQESQLLEVIQFGQLNQDGNEDKLAIKITALEGCAIVYSQAIGASAVKQLMRVNIQPIKVDAGQEIQPLLTALQDELHNGLATSWLAKIISTKNKDDASRFDQMVDEGWQES